MGIPIAFEIHIWIIGGTKINQDNLLDLLSQVSDASQAQIFL